MCFYFALLCWYIACIHGVQSEVRKAIAQYQKSVFEYHALIAPSKWSPVLSSRPQMFLLKEWATRGKFAGSAYTSSIPTRFLIRIVLMFWCVRRRPSREKRDVKKREKTWKPRFKTFYFFEKRATIEKRNKRKKRNVFKNCVFYVISSGITVFWRLR